MVPYVVRHCLWGLSLAWAAGAAQAGSLLESAMPPHTLRTIEVRDPSQSNWVFAFAPLSEHALLHFTDERGEELAANVYLPLSQAFRYGFSFDDGADFDAAYAVIAIRRDVVPDAQGNPKCVFVLTALKPAVPQQGVSNFAGAACRLERDAQGDLRLILDGD